MIIFKNLKIADIFFIKSFKIDVFFLLVLLVFTAGILLSVDCLFLVYDDIGILHDIRGGFPVSFMAVPLGYFLSFLHRFIFMDAPWYALFLYGTHFFSLFLIIRTTYKILPEKRFFIPIVSLVALFYSTFMIGVTFSSAAFMIGGAGVFAFLVSLKHDQGRMRADIVYGACLALGYLIRPESFKGLLVFSFPVLFCLGWQYRRYWRRAGFFLLPLFLVFGVNQIVSRYGVSEEHRRFVEFDILRGKFHGFPVEAANMKNTQVVQNILQENRWTSLDYAMLLNWNFLNEKKFNVTTMRTIFKHSAEIKQDVDFQQVVASTRAILKSYNEFLLLLIGMALLAAFRGRWTAALLAFGYGCYIIGIAVYMSIFYRFPERIGQPLILFAVLIALCIFYFGERGFLKYEQRARISGLTADSNRFVYGLFICFVLIIGYQNLWYAVVPQIRHNARVAAQYNKTVDWLNTHYSGKFFVIDPTQGREEGLNPLRPQRYDFKVIWGGWDIFSPRFYHNLDEMLGLRYAYEIYPELAVNPDVYLVASGIGGLSIFRYIRETYGGEYSIRVVDQLGPHRYIFDIKRIDLD